MPLPEPQARTRLHERRLSINGYQREDGLFDIEGYLVDTKTYDFDSHWRGTVAAGVPVHEMWLRLTIDKTLRIREVASEIDFGPFPPCYEVAPNFERLAGLRIGPGWMGEVRKRVGGIKGCTHLNEMLAQIATTAFQTMVRHWESERKKREAEAEANGDKLEAGRRPQMIGSCYALAADGPVVEKIWPEFHVAPAGGEGG
ncbi:MAG: DUF2889 domain-containing protein [Alphaproteobacteria bacterium]